MHESAVCREIAEIVQRAAEENDISRVYEILVCVGEYSCVNEHQLNFYFDLYAQGTCMENAKISIEKDLSLTGRTQMYIKTFRGE